MVAQIKNGVKTPTQIHNITLHLVMNLLKLSMVIDQPSLLNSTTLLGAVKLCRKEFTPVLF